MQFVFLKRCTMQNGKVGQHQRSMHTFPLFLLGWQLTMCMTPVTPTTSSRPSSIRGFSKRLSLSDPQRSAPDPQLRGENTTVTTCGPAVCHRAPCLVPCQGRLVRQASKARHLSQKPEMAQLSCTAKAGSTFLKFLRLLTRSFRSERSSEITSFHLKEKGQVRPK